MSADSRMAKMMALDAQRIADDAWLFTLPELIALAPVYAVEPDGMNFGTLRRLIATKRAAWCRPQADPVSLTDYDEWAARASGESGSETE